MFARIPTPSRTRRATPRARSLFQALSAELTPDLAGSAGITVYNARGNPLAWAGRVSDVPRDRIDGPSVLFVSLDPLGPRLVRVEPVPDPVRAGAPRLATIVAEQLRLERTDVPPSVSDTFRLPTSVVDVNVRATPGLAPPQPPFSFAIRTAQGQVLATAEVSPADLAAARATWQSWIRAAVVGVLGLTILLCAAPVLEARRHARRPGAFVLTTGSLVACLAIGRTLLRAAFLPVVGGSIAGPAELLPDALLLTALVWLAIDTIEQRRVSRPRAHLIANERAATLVTVAAFSAAERWPPGLVAAERVLEAFRRRRRIRELLASSIRSGTARHRSRSSCSMLP